MTSSREDRYFFLLRKHFTPLEARELSALPKGDSVLRFLVQAREARRYRFERIASRKIYTGAWRRESLPQKWIDNLSRLYYRSGWRVQEGPRGRQRAMPKGSPNPWAMYRAAVKVAPPKRDISPWVLRQVRKGGTRLERGLIFIQQAERKGGLSRARVEQWLAEKDAAIKKARGQRRAQLQIERNRLVRMLD